MVAWFAPTFIDSDRTVSGEFVDFGIGTGSAGEYTTTTMEFGDEHPQRWLVAGVSYIASSASVDTVTIGGVTATEIVQRSVTAGVTIICGFWKALVPTGTSGVVVVTGGINTPAGGAGLYRIVASGLDATTSGGTSITNVAEASVSARAGDFLIGVSASRRATTVPTSLAFTGITEDLEISVLGQNGRMGWGHAVPSTAQTVDVDVTYTGGSGAQGAGLALASIREAF